MLHIIKIFSISVIIIFLLHQLWNFIKNTYSTKKTKDIVSFQTQKYKSILQEILSNTNNTNNLSTSLTEIPNSDFISQQDMSSMNEELDVYVREQLSSIE
jgi:hypothetical protein